MAIALLANILFWACLWRWMRDAEDVRREQRLWDALSDEAWDSLLECACGTSANCPVHGPIKVDGSSSNFVPGGKKWTP
jgi:hypothetical protein